MKISDQTNNFIVDNIFSGSYSVNLNGKRGKFYEFSSPSFPISFFSTPYSAILPNSTGGFDGVATRIKSGCPVRTDRSGALYFYDDSIIAGTCHGFGHNEKTYYLGANFYNAFYPVGYFSPPYGESISLFKANQDGYENLKNGACNDLNVTEYNENFGIVSKSSSDSELLSTTLTKNVYSPIFSPREACPPEVASTSYYDEIQFSQIPGTTKSLTAANYNNDNPIPTSLDSFDLKVNGRYQISGNGTTNFIVFEDGRPNPSYSVSGQTNKLNNNLCFATIMETKVSSNRGTNGVQLITAPDASQGVVGDQVSFVGADHFQYWHFTFRENAETLPFLNDFVGITEGPVRARKLSEGTQLFDALISSEDYYWKNRQCPDTVDFLPYTFGANIYACPSEHFDIPYYAALRKFGFYGTRFLNTCKALSLESSVNGVPNSSELDESSEPLDIGKDETELDDIDKDGYWNFPVYENLLNVAKSEERYANMYALNKGFFIWANDDLIKTEDDFTYLSGQSAGFITLYNNLFLSFEKVFTGGFASFLGEEPTLVMKASNDTFTIIHSGIFSDILQDNSVFLKFKKDLRDILTGNGQIDRWDNLEKKYSYYVSNGNGINEDFYSNIISGREERIRTRYFENILRGNPIDLFPFNSITFSTDYAKDYIENDEWSRKAESFGESSSLPEIQRRYFEGAYGNSSSISELVDKLNNLNIDPESDFYPGFFQDTKIGKFLPTPKYENVISGLIADTEGRSFSPSGWLALGYNEVGKLDGNFSCFTPIIIKQPFPTVFTKIGQHPTFRCLAVDYHSIPEDKISRRYPEIIFWCSKLKILDCNGINLYPLRYKWLRIPKDKYDNTLTSGYFYQKEFESNVTGDWGCIEGDGPNCTLFHPNDSFPLFSGGTQDINNYTFIKGAIKNNDDNFYYFCSVSGRFGLRISNPMELQIEDWVRFDISVKNGLNMPGDIKVDFLIKDYKGVDRTIEFKADKLPNYAGYEQNLSIIPESVIEQKIPPPNAGFGDVTAFRFIGPHGYAGATRSYSPSRLTDTRGLRETWGHFIDYGELVSFSKNLIQQQGDWLYGYSHLPICDNYQMGNGKAGIKTIPYINGNKVQHWSLEQKATASLDNIAGIQWNKLFNIGELYPPSNSRIDNVFPNFAIGQWQWGNNLGAIKRFGKFSTSKDINFVGGIFSAIGTPNNQIISQIQDKLVGASDLAGVNCGYSKYGFGRNVVYYLEAFERFYLICDPLKKKNVTNKSFICPGIRMNNSAIQYSWLGNPSNTYLTRRPMYGPYAFQWRVEKHNRDRNGNGMSEGFYSMGYAKRYSLMYDAPSIYGLYVRTKQNSKYLTATKEINELKSTIMNTLGLDNTTIRSFWFGQRGQEGTSRAYGDYSFSCSQNDRTYNDNLCTYVSKAQALATDLNFSDYRCPQDLLNEGACFDPCLSIRHGQGFYPGGKLLDLFGFGGGTSINDINDFNTRIVPLATFDKTESPKIIDEIINFDSNLQFRSPINTPHARITRSLIAVDGKKKSPKYVAGVSTCQDGGSDHCNYNTPTLHLDVSSFLTTDGNVFQWLKNYTAEVYHSDYNIRGEIT